MPNVAISRDQRLCAAAVWSAAILDFVGVTFLEAMDDASPPEFLQVGFAIGLFAFIAAQFSLLAVWFVFAPQSLLARSATALSSAVFIALAIRFAMARYDWEYFVRATVFWLSSLPMMGLAATALLWPFRFFRGWRLDSREAAASGPMAPQFQIRDLFIVTALIAVALAALRFAIAREEEFARPDWLAMLGTGGTLAVVGLLSAMPPLWAAFEIKEWQAGIALLLGYAALLTCAELALITPFAFGGGGAPFDAIFGICYGQFVCLAWSFAILRVARRWGCVLVRPSRHPPATLNAPAGWKPESPAAVDAALGNLTAETDHAINNSGARAPQL